MARRAIKIADPKLAEVVRRLVETLHPERIYLFGSRARGEGTDESDYDVLVLVGYPAERPYRLEQQAYHALWGVRVPVDVLVMTVEFFERRRRVIASLPATVAREGKLLYVA